MKIAFVAPFGLGQKTTVWARTLPLAKELVKLGHTVTILIPPWDTPSDSGKTWTDAGVELVNVSIRGGLLPTIIRLLHALRSRQPDIIHIVKPRAHAGIIQWLLWYFRVWILDLGFVRAQSKLQPLNSKIFLDLDDWEQAWAEINHYPWLVAKFLAWQEEWGIRHADRITVASRWLEGRVKEYASSTPTLYLPNGVGNVERGKGGKGETGRQGEWEKLNHASRITDHATRNTHHAPCILYLTRYVEVEPQWLADFAQALHTRLPTAQLIIAGEPLQPGRDQAFRSVLSGIVGQGESETVASETVDSDQSPNLPISNLQSPISFLGKVTRAQINHLYTIVDCAIFPSALSVLQQSKCSVRLATTLLHGVPVIASAVGEQSHYGAEGAARLVAADATPAQFADAVVELLGDQAAQIEMIERARVRLSEHYDWGRFGERLVKFYEM